MQEYLSAVVKTLHATLRDEDRYLRKKVELQTDIPQLQGVIVEQYEQAQQHIFRHAQHFEKNKKRILAHFGQDMHKQDVIMHFLTAHAPQFNSLLFQQQARIQPHPNRWKIFDKPFALYHKFTSTDLQGLLHTEEVLYTEFLELVYARTKKIDTLADYIANCESYDAFKQKALRGGATITAIPLGPLEFAAAPLWGAYFTMQELEKRRNEFKEWRKINKPRITK